MFSENLDCMFQLFGVVVVDLLTAIVPNFEF